jgi:CheY-like chemotaxis protein
MPKTTKVLMVDDDKMLLDMYKERLDMAGFQVETSSNGEECLAKIHQVKPDIVLLDIMMPKVNGYDTLASIKSDPQTKDTPVIILSALVRDINKSRAIEAGADDYIIKSEVMPADVIKKVENVLAKYHKDVVTQPSVEPKDSVPAKVQNPVVSPPSSIPMPTPKVAPVAPKEPTPPPAAPTPIAPPALSKTTTPAPEIQFEPGVTQKNSSSTLYFLVLILLIVLAGSAFFFCTYIREFD